MTLSIRRAGDRAGDRHPHHGCPATHSRPAPDRPDPAAPAPVQAVAPRPYISVPMPVAAPKPSNPPAVPPVPAAPVVPVPVVVAPPAPAAVPPMHLPAPVVGVPFPDRVLRRSSVRVPHASQPAAIPSPVHVPYPTGGGTGPLFPPHPVPPGRGTVPKSGGPGGGHGGFGGGRRCPYGSVPQQIDPQRTRPAAAGVPARVVSNCCGRAGHCAVASTGQNAAGSRADRVSALGDGAANCPRGWERWWASCSACR